MHSKEVISKARADRRGWLDILDKRDSEGKASGKDFVKPQKVVCAIQEPKSQIKRKQGRFVPKRDEGHSSSKSKEKPLDSSDSEFVGQLVALLAGEDNSESARELRTKVHVEAEFIGFQIPIKIIALLDSGASKENYLTSEFYYRYESEMQ